MSSSVDWNNLNNLSLVELKGLCTKYNIKIDGKLTKLRHIQALEEYRDKNISTMTITKVKKTRNTNQRMSSGNSLPTTPLSNQQTPQKIAPHASTPVTVDTPVVPKLNLSLPVTSRESTPISPLHEQKTMDKTRFYVVFTAFIFFLILSITLFIFSNKSE